MSSGRLRPEYPNEEQASDREKVQQQPTEEVGSLPDATPAYLVGVRGPAAEKLRRTVPRVLGSWTDKNYCLRQLHAKDYPQSALTYTKTAMILDLSNAASVKRARA